MKSTAIIACLFAISFTFAYSEIQIPESIKDNAKQLYFQNNLDEKDIVSILEDFSNKKIVNNIPVGVQVYNIPEGGKTDFIKISGGIAEFGRTAQITLEITKPDGTIEKFQSPLLETGRYHTVYPISENSQVGTYIVQTVFAGERHSESFFHLTKTQQYTSNFPPWIVSTFEWWIQDEISDSEIVSFIEHLAKLGLISIPEKSLQPLQVVITGENMVRRGITHTINVQVTDGYAPIEGAKVTLSIEDYGENIIREFEGRTDQNGYFIYSWEIPKSFDNIETLLAFISVSGNDSSTTHLWKFQVYCLPGTANCKIDGN
ncbi:MAG: hypothetical protein OEL77_03100 [Nitrosopumilus sp.]|nr:hypothetical protein [Nitrosopumilus sp.]MDH3384983.1 hypothetical protein [Nitrosopumilus sp.]